MSWTSEDVRIYVATGELPEDYDYGLVGVASTHSLLFTMTPSAAREFAAEVLAAAEYADEITEED